jgi:hypothetical protein
MRSTANYRSALSNVWIAFNNYNGALPLHPSFLARELPYLWATTTDSRRDLRATVGLDGARKHLLAGRTLMVVHFRLPGRLSEGMAIVDADGLRLARILLEGVYGEDPEAIGWGRLPPPGPARNRARPAFGARSIAVDEVDAPSLVAAPARM